MKISLHILPILTVLTLSAHSQETDTFDLHKTVIKKSIQLVTGFTFGRSKYVEIGIAKNSYAIVGHHPSSNTIFASTEMKFGQKFIIGPKIGCWAGGGVAGMAMGASMIYYTDFDDGTLVFRPDIGFGFAHFKFVYGYNFRLTKNKLAEIDYSVGSIFIGIGIKKLKEKVVTW
ncbi:hypothetical protein A3860_13555 [Niastella vici]|uniref:DUF3575 domain-containing protein n=1 Tax=Niastella vici TaxID=1703345 RepID=A0A1V9G7Q7_9BACT|nr:hypothetical protein [Niastella vici]OQP66506.1 hypothetical protein A3860_13555 [Niastella vici]